MGDNLRGAICPAGMGKIIAVSGRMMVSDRSGNVLLNAFLQPLGCTFYVLAIALAHKSIDNIVVVKGM